MGRGIRAKSLMSTGMLHHFGHLLQVSNKYLPPLTLYTSFLDLINVYIRRSRTDNPQGTKFWCQQKPLATSVICYKFQNNLWCLILYTFFHDFIHVYSPGADSPLGTKFWCQQKHLVTSVICWKFWEKNLWSLNYTIYFMLLYMYIVPGQEQTATRGQSFDVNRKVLSLHSFVASFK